MKKFKGVKLDFCTSYFLRFCSGNISRTESFLVEVHFLSQLRNYEDYIELSRGALLVAEVYDEFQRSNETKGLRESSIKHYANNLRSFFAYLAELGVNNIESISVKEYKDFISWLQKKNLKPSTVRAYLGAVKSFLYYAMRKGYLETFDMHLPKLDSIGISEIYTKEEIKRLVKRPAKINKISFAEYRNWVLVCYLLETGNRLSTVINIKVRDVDLNKGIVYLKWTKNRQESLSPLSKEMQLIMKEYIMKAKLDNDNYLFPSVAGGKLSERGLQHAIKSYNKSRGVEKASVHAFRHTFATSYLGRGGDSLVLQRLLGHATMKTTLKYVQLSSIMLARDAQRRHSIIARHANECLFG